MASENEHEEKKKLVVVGSIVQIDPECKANPMFGACMLTVTEVKDWGVQGYVQALGDLGQIGGQAYIRLGWESIEPTGGSAVWAIGVESDQEGENG